MRFINGIQEVHEQTPWWSLQRSAMHGQHQSMHGGKYIFGMSGPEAQIPVANMPSVTFSVGGADAAPSSAPANSADPAEKKEQEKQKPTSGGSTMMWVGGTVLGIALVGTGIYLARR